MPLSVVPLDRLDPVVVAVLGRLALGGLVLLVAAVASRYVRAAAHRWVQRGSAKGLARTAEAQARSELRSETLGNVAGDVMVVALWSVALLVALGQLGIDLGPLVAGAGVAGVAIGFGAQSLVRDFLSGFFILLEDQFGVGDVVKVNNDLSGLVEDLSLRVCRLRSLDGTVHFIPNGSITTLSNMSKEWARALVDVEVAYREDTDVVIGHIRQVAAELRDDPDLAELILEDVEILGVERLGTSGVTIRCYLKTKPLEQWTVARAFRAAIKHRFDAVGIEIPFPHTKIVLDGATDGAR